MSQPRLIQSLVLGLPIGLFVIGAGSLVWHFKHPKPAGKPPLNPPGSRPVAQADLEFYVKRLANDIGPRPALNLVNSRSTASFLKGTLGSNNIGYSKVEETKLSVSDDALVNLSVEVPGHAEAPALILVAAHYDTAPDSPGANANGSGVAANLALANLFLGTTHQNTLRFCFFANALGTPPRGSEAYAQALKARGGNVAAVLVLDSLGCYTEASNSQPPWPTAEANLSTTGDFLAFLGQPAQKALLAEISPLFTNTGFPLQSALVADSGSPVEQAFAALHFPTLCITDTATLRQSTTGTVLDTPTQLNFPSFIAATQALGRMLDQLAK